MIERIENGKDPVTAVILITWMLSAAAFGQPPSSSPLEKLGPLAAPSIIRLMDDRRPLTLKQTEFLNTARGAWEGILHDNSEFVVDALSAVLMLLTGEGVGTVGSENERRQAVNAWRTYLHYRVESEAAPEARALAPVPTKQTPTNKNR